MNPPKKARGTGSKSTEEENDTPVDAIELLKEDHREVEQLFERCRTADGAGQKERLVQDIATALFTHTIIEEEIFYPACRDKGVDTGPLDEAQVEHDTVKLLLDDLLDSDPDDDEYFDAKIRVLSEYVKHHVNEEEKENEGLFSRAKTAGVDVNEIGSKLKSRKREVKMNEKRTRRRPEIRSFHHQSQEESPMGRYASDREGRSGYAGEREESGRGSGRDYEQGYRGGSSRFQGREEPYRRRQAGDNDVGYGRRPSSQYGQSGRYEEESGGRGRGYSGASRNARDMYESGPRRSFEDYDEGDYRDDRRSGSYGFRDYDDSDDDSDYGRRGWNR